MGKTTKKEKKNKKKITFGSVVGGFFKTVFTAVLLVLILACGIGGGVLAGVAIGCVITTQPLTRDDLYSSEYETAVYDSDGKQICTLNSQSVKNSIWVDIDDVPENLQHAFVAIEDERFYTHHGVDLKRTASAVLGFLIPGQSGHGGSTITQQLVKNVTGDDSRSVPRKIREQWRAIQLEQLLDDKDEILELYLNKIFFANNCYGVRVASYYYFGVDVSELNLAQCAYLAGIPNNPAKFNPAKTAGRQNEYKRQIIILDNMLDQGYITDEEYREAIQTDLNFVCDRSAYITADTVYSYFVDAVIKEVRTDLMAAGYTKNEANNLIYNSGVKIYTTQDSAIQKTVDSVFCNDAYFRVNPGRDPEDCAQAAIVVMDHHNGRVVAMYGGYGPKTQSLSYNRATDIKRQPGSSIKPLLVYGPLIDTGVITVGEAMDELPVALDDQNPNKIWPSNWDNFYHGYLNARYALDMSYNIPAATWFKSHMQTCLGYLLKSGIDKTDEPYLSTALGGFQKGVSPIEMSAGYSMIANGGVYYKPTLYTKVYTQDNQLLLDNTQRTGDIVYEHEETASLVTSMLDSVVWDHRSTGRYVQIEYDGVRLPMGGKTGSTNDLKDYWFCGFTSYYTAACWYGYDNSTSIDEKTEGGSAMYIWQAIMREVHEKLPIKDLPMSGNLVSVEICTSSGKRATDACREDPRCADWIYTEYYVKGTEPAPDEYCDVHLTTEVCTASVDRFGKHCLATEYCKLFDETDHNLVTVSGQQRTPEAYEYLTDLIDKYNEEYGGGGEDRLLTRDWEYEISHEYCTVCEERAKKLGLVPENDPEGEEEKEANADTKEDAEESIEDKEPGDKPENGNTPAARTPANP